MSLQLRGRNERFHNHQHKLEVRAVFSNEKYPLVEFLTTPRNKCMSLRPNMSSNIVHRPSQFSKGTLQLQKQSHPSLYDMKGRLRTGTGADKLRDPTHMAPAAGFQLPSQLRTTTFWVDIWPEMLSLSELVNSSTLENVRKH